MPDVEVTDFAPRRIDREDSTASITTRLSPFLTARFAVSRDASTARAGTATPPAGVGSQGALPSWNSRRPRSSGPMGVAFDQPVSV